MRLVNEKKKKKIYIIYLKNLKNKIKKNSE